MTRKVLNRSKATSTAIHAAIWLTFPEQIDDPDLLSRYQALLATREHRQQQRFHFARHRHRYLITRALVRTTLSRYAPAVQPRDWQFVHNQHGRPEIAPGQTDLPLRFNLSHTDGLIACAVIKGRAIGIDVEDSQRDARTVEVAERFFSDQECQDLRALDSAAQIDRFFDYWTLKESYIKARGLGLALPLGQFSFHLPVDRPIHISFSERIKDDPQRWQFRLLRPTQRHRLALCVETHAAKLHIALYKVVPLHSVTLLSPGDQAVD